MPQFYRLKRALINLAGDYTLYNEHNQAIGTLDGKVPYEMSGVLSVVIDAATRDAQSTNFGSDAAEPVVLLSPACASFDQYRNFEVRGTAFRDIVLGLPGINPRG